MDKLVISARIVVDRADLPDGKTQSVKLLEDCDDLRHQVLVHDQLARWIWPSKPMWSTSTRRSRPY
jgi:hypothetical protein